MVPTAATARGRVDRSSCVPGSGSPFATSSSGRSCRAPTTRRRRSRYRAGEGSVDRFVARMNATARELGLTGTRYRNPHGLDQPGHVSTARDVARLLRVALRDPFIRRYAGSARATLSNGTVVTSTDNLFGVVPGFVGGKTGHTDGAGWSQVAAARRDGVGITAAVLGGPSEAQRDRDLAALLRYGLAAYRPSRVVDPARVYASVEVGWGRAPVGLVATPRGRPSDSDGPSARRAGRGARDRRAPGAGRRAPRLGRRARRGARRRASAARRRPLGRAVRGVSHGRRTSPAAPCIICWAGPPR